MFMLLFTLRLDHTVFLAFTTLINKCNTFILYNTDSDI